jgi:hypothetical protein
VWRIATSEDYRDSYADIMDRWELSDLQSAHMLLDAIESARARARAQD